MTYRESNIYDKPAIIELINKCFGSYPWKYRGAIEDLDGRYLLVFDENRLIAMSGISIKHSMFNGYEIDWTCTDPEYQNQGIISDLLIKLVNELPDDNIDIYCTCWRFNWENTINLHNAMQKIGAIEVVHKDTIYVAPMHLECNDCIYKQKECMCFTDLYKVNRSGDLK